MLSEGEESPIPPTGWKDAASIASYFARANYNFNDKYFATFTMRADGSSKFGPDNRWGYFPSGSVAWRPSNSVKVRLGYGVVRSHSETLAILQSLNLSDRVRLPASHFLALPAIVRRSDLGVVMPAELAIEWVSSGEFSLIDLPGHWPAFVVSLHASRAEAAGRGAGVAGGGVAGGVWDWDGAGGRNVSFALTSRSPGLWGWESA